MSEIKNNFCWSYSQSKDFSDCKRRHYWNRYGFWGGWNSSSSASARNAYRLKQMANKWSLIGNAVDLSITEMVHRYSVGANITYQLALDNANAYLRQAWQQHCSGNWSNNPKYTTCIRELYFDQITTKASKTRKEWTNDVKLRTEKCLKTFFDLIVPRLERLKQSDFLPVDLPGHGDPEHFYFDKIKIYAIPDCAFKLDGMAHILDWKSGALRDTHQLQIKVYGLWAQQKFGLQYSEIELFLEYLNEGISQKVNYLEDDVNQVIDYINASVTEMRKYLVNGSITDNQALPIEAFPKTENLNSCKLCNFVELCDRSDIMKVKI